MYRVMLFSVILYLSDKILSYFYLAERYYSLADCKVPTFMPLYILDTPKRFRMILRLCYM